MTYPMDYRKKKLKDKKKLFADQFLDESMNRLFVPGKVVEETN